ncbi:MAG: zinc-ribbon domain containing protein [Chloroflexi bacterium]|nr:zinc-ribbon domain containing protein [Chloroflexota bacterium]
MPQDKTLVCRDCGQNFVFTEGEQEFYQSRGFTNEPTRCPSCRAARKNERGDSGGGRGGYGGGAGGGGRSSGGGGGGYGYERAPREMHPATCAQCGKETQVPFLPTSGRPVYCSDCFEQTRGGSGGGGGGRSSGGGGGGGGYRDRY